MYGYGRMTISEVFDKYQLTAQQGMQILNRSGIEANAQDKIRNVAEDNNLKPIDLIEIIEKGQEAALKN